MRSRRALSSGLPSRVLSAAEHADVLQRQRQASVLQRVSQPEEVAALAWFVAARALRMTGSVLLMDNGLHLNAGLTASNRYEKESKTAGKHGWRHRSSAGKISSQTVTPTGRRAERHLIPETT
jgi:hypothetical protein